ncbi:DUF1992 domain-containing protein [Cohnella pontilimi]|uniref:DUF1992 domain-containing protein n=1 Tax=Cohnella pontilimi TaxID=2564100 RepID=A0A4U0F8X0_9BACL|nr:DUF1992 domain-containing protein [Cohnella pontilimi]TJY41081.1 DUF1992 domain-containing protein [Cohnella pontilimi]
MNPQRILYLSSRNWEADPAGATEDEEPAAPGAFWNSTVSVEHWAQQIYNEEMKKGTFEHLPGKGKPMEVPDGDLANSILKNANVLPDWLMLQHEIRDQMQALLNATHPDAKQVERELDDINRKIKKYNTMVPSVVLQKRKITKEDMHKLFHLWA